MVLKVRREEVKKAFRHAWTGYATYCMGNDTLHPVTNTCDDDFAGWGATAIDALSTAIMFEEETVVRQILQFIATVDFTRPTNGMRIQLFELTIRHLGSMISAHDLLSGPFRHIAEDQSLRDGLYRQMVNLGNALDCGFNTPSGIPRNWIDPAICKTDDGLSNAIAGIGTLILEFDRLSSITGNDTYVRHARLAEQFLLYPFPQYNEPFPGLIGSFLSIIDGRIINSKGSWGSFSDSYYEYLIKAYVYDRGAYAMYLDRWKLAVDSTIRYLASHPVGHPEWTLLPYFTGRYLSNAMDSLSWFAGGNIILGGMALRNQTLIDFGLTIADTSGAMYEMTKTGLGGEFIVWTNDCSQGFLHDFNLTECNASNSVQITSNDFKLRPEVIETWYYAYRATQDPKYREWAWKAFEAINRVCRTESGFSAISDVDAIDGGTQLDRMESFVLAELLKYVWLIHLDDDAPFHVQDGRKGKHNTWVYNTEAHPLKVKGRPV
ncbi:glycoside hydrolase family 47 protein [Baudoinia panamericana UAMH 10762]|uniref:alpha-1,2-Mannosidase n=1 Tax=Baudoinia panamericana (strain UAMH 10762) TaxID=717646 RepID=M2MPA6_BAUPA|nr:glycoside hydrolase family 47 protein [Baudoinia panamericana UAMH 10762]EMC93303.1 glycoside hydrolase family 47 protein [Baudoinia panamericana UAMH 10762]